MAGVVYVTKKSTDAPINIRKYLNLWFDIINATFLIPNSTPDDPDPMVQVKDIHGDKQYPLSRFAPAVVDWFYGRNQA